MVLVKKTGEEFNYDNCKRRLESLFSQDNIDVEIQCCYSVLYIMIYEHIKFMLIDQIISFFCEDYTNIKKNKKSKKYIEACEKAGGAFEYGFEFYHLSDEQRRVLKNAQERRGQATHQFLNLFMNEDHFSFRELKNFFEIARYIDNYWIENFEIAISDNINVENAYIENAHSVYFVLISAVAQRIFPLENAAKIEQDNRHSFSPLEKK